MRLPTAKVTTMASPPRASWRRPERSMDRPVSPPDGRPAGEQRHGCDHQSCGQYMKAEQVGQQGYQGAEGERQQRRRARQHRRGQVVRVNAEFLAGMHPQGSARVLGDGGGHAGRGVGISAVAAEVAGELVLLGRGEPGQHLAFERDLGVDQFVLVGDRDVFAGAHRERASDQRRHPGEHDRVR